MTTPTSTQRPSATAATICSEAIALAEETGWNKLTVRALAQRIGYSPPILYQHFRNKEHLLREVMQQGFDLLRSEMHGAAGTSTDPQRALVAVARARLRFALTHPALHSLMFASGSPCWQREATLHGMAEASALVSELLERITGRTDGCPELKTHFVALIKGYTYFATEMPHLQGPCTFFAHNDPEEALAQAMERFIASIQSSVHE